MQRKKAMQSGRISYIEHLKLNECIAHFLTNPIAIDERIHKIIIYPNRNEATTAIATQGYTAQHNININTMQTTNTH